MDQAGAMYGMYRLSGMARSWIDELVTRTPSVVVNAAIAHWLGLRSAYLREGEGEPETNALEMIAPENASFLN
jgi:hypothetical protein